MASIRLTRLTLLLGLSTLAVAAQAASFTCTDRWGHRYVLPQLPVDNSDSMKCTASPGSAPARAGSRGNRTPATATAARPMATAARPPNPAEAAAALGLKGAQPAPAQPPLPAPAPVLAAPVMPLPVYPAPAIRPLAAATTGTPSAGRPAPIPPPIAAVARPVQKPARPADVASVFGFSRTAASAPAP